MEGEPTAKNVQKGARFKIQRESEARMLIILTPPERGKMRASVLKNHLTICPLVHANEKLLW